MSYIPHLGNPVSKLWILFERPFGSDIQKTELCSGGMGFAFKKMLSEAGIDLGEVFLCSRKPDTDSPNSVCSIESSMQYYQPPLLVLVGEAGGYFLPDLRPREKDDSYRTQLNKYVGSLLSSPNFSAWAHYCMPIQSPDDLMKDWRERNVTTYVDLGKIKEELDYFKTNQSLRPLRTRVLLHHEMETDEILKELEDLRTYPALSEDIETVYPRKGSEYYQEYPGVPIVLGIASGPERAISFCPFRETSAATREVFRAFDKLHNGTDCPIIIGQNFFNFDSWFYSMMGFAVPRERISDTLIRHHILWPELPHKLQFLTRQYTRQPYYKDEGRTFNPKNLSGLRHYNCLDAAVTFEVWNGQEEEFKQRPHLR